MDMIMSIWNGVVAQKIHSANLLDQRRPGGKILSFHLASGAFDLDACLGFLNHEDRAVAGIAKKIGEETYFHLKYAQGWFQIIGEGKNKLSFQKAEIRSRLLLDGLAPAGQRPGTQAVTQHSLKKTA